MLFLPLAIGNVLEGVISFVLLFCSPCRTEAVQDRLAAA
jgi:hypothetical protein